MEEGSLAGVGRATLVSGRVRVGNTIKEDAMHRLKLVAWLVGVVGLWSAVAFAADAGSAVLRVEGDGTYDLRGRVVRCEQGKPVGLWVEGRRAITLANVVVEGCEVGILVRAAATGEGSDAGAEQRVHVQGVTVRATSVGIWLAGNGSIASENIVGEATYGFVVTGDDNVLTDNRSNDNSVDGFLVTGDRNVLEGNKARRNGKVGIHVASMVPLVGNRKAVFPLQDRGQGNSLRANTALANRLDLRDFTENCLELEPSNTWSGNTFGTRQPACIE
jgi:parallel beta-helix repeat protein